MSMISARYFLAISTILITSFALNAQAEGVYLLQLGSFEKKEEANAKWQSLRGKYPQLLGELNVRLQDVTLPPDNFTVYRTQAGALKSRANAQSICDRLTQGGDECYVVETAMVASSSDELKRTPPIEQEPTFTTRAESPKASAPTPSDIPKALPAPDVVIPAVAATDSSAKLPFGVVGIAPSLAKAPESAKAAISSAPAIQSAVDAQTPVPPLVTVPLVNQAEVPVSPAPSTRILSSKEAKLQARKQLDKIPESAIPTSAPTSVLEVPVTQAAAQALVAPEADIPVAEPEEEASFWSTVGSLDPFSDDETPIENEKTPELAPSIRPQAVDIPAPPPVDSAISSLIDQIEFIDGAPTSSVSTAPVTAAPILPDLPPPPPVSAGANIIIAQTPPTVAIPVAAATPIPVTPVIPPRPDLPPPPPVSSQPVIPSVADVSVSEAVPVPLSQDPIVEPIIPARQTYTPPMSMGLPSQQTPGRKSLWAQISYFPDQQAALAYWENFRKANPTFPAVRVRITNPYAIQSSTPQVSLRVGPFDRGDYVKDICDEVETQEIFCKAVTDLGESTTARTNRDRMTSRYESYYGSGSQSATEMYWVQLGSFLSPGDAKNAWAQMAQTYSPALNGLDPNVAPPVMSSSMQSIYRLRSGPYPLRNKADELCGRLRTKGSNCLIVFSR